MGCSCGKKKAVNNTPRQTPKRKFVPVGKKNNSVRRRIIKRPIYE